METAIDVMAPVQRPMMAVLMNMLALAGLSSSKKEPAIATIRTATDAGLDIACFLLNLNQQHNFYREIFDGKTYLSSAS